MASSQASTVEDYLEELDGRAPERAALVRPVLDVVRANLPEGYEEVVNWGMICWQVPLSVYPDTYNKQPLMFAGLGNQKNYVSLYLLPVYGDPESKKILDNAGKKLKMGKSCINYLRVDELPLGAIGEIVRRCQMEPYIAIAKAANSDEARNERRKRREDAATQN